MGEHGHHDLIHDLQLRLIQSRDFDENVLCAQFYLGVIAVDDWGKRADSPIGVIDDGVHRRVSNNVEVLSEVLVFLLICVNYVCLVL